MRAADVIIVGGGIIGGAMAFELARVGRRVILLDRQRPGMEASWAAAGMLSAAPHSPEAVPLVPLARASLALYPDFVAAVGEASGMAAGLQRDGGLHALFGAAAERERDALLAQLRALGLAAEAISANDACRMEPALSPAAGAVARLPGEASVDNRALTEAALAAASNSGATIRGGVEVTGLLVEGGRCRGVAAGTQRILADAVVIAAGCYSAAIAGVGRYAPVRPARGQMVALRGGVTPGRVLRSERGYLVPRNDGRVLAGSTIEDAGFDKRVTPAGLQQILAAAVELAPSLENAAVVETWSGLRPDTPDHLPILGPTDVEGLWIATGHFRNGVLLAPVTAQLLGEWLTEGKTSLDAQAFSPLRFLRAAAKSQ